jgi:ligand-binding sensor protein
MMKTCISNKNNGNFKTIQKLVSTYTRTTGSKVRFYDLNHLPLTCTLEEKEVEESICKYCPVHQNTQTVKRTEPCHEMHINAIGESSRSDGMVLYTCEKGLLFWACPIFDNGRFAGALRGSGYLDPMSEKGTINDAFLEQLKTLPEGNLERIKSMAEMLLLYAATLSTGNEDHHEILRRRTEQQKDISAKIEK